jgi:hypothetical protein
MITIQLLFPVFKVINKKEKEKESAH